MDNMKKSAGVFALLGIFIAGFVFSAGFASALSPKEVVESTITAFNDLFGPVLNALFGGTGDSGMILFEKLMILIIFISLVYLSLSQIDVFNDNKKILIIISIVLPLIGVRFLDYAWLMRIIFQYKATAIIMTGLLPFILFFFFVHKVAGEHDVIRKVCWIFFIAVYIGLWASTEVGQEGGDIYLWTMAAALLFLVLDGTIHRYMLRQEMKEAHSASKWEHVAKLRRDIWDVQESVRMGHITERMGRSIIKTKQKQIGWYLKSSDI